VQKEISMKLRPSFDDEFQPKRIPWSWSIRSVGHLMLVVSVCGLPLGIMAGMGKLSRYGQYLPARFQRPVQGPLVKAFVASPRDHFVVIAPAEIDARMVWPAPAGIDEAMVLNPLGGG
jgi:hypothetical protein